MVRSKGVAATTRLKWMAAQMFAMSMFMFDGAAAEDLSGTWSGIMVKDHKQGAMTLTIQPLDQGYSAKYEGIPSFSGPLLSVSAGPGKQPDSTQFTAVSKELSLAGGNAGRLRFYLLKPLSQPQLRGVIRMELDTGQDQDFMVVLERRPCCDGACVLREGCN